MLVQDVKCSDHYVKPARSDTDDDEGFHPGYPYLSLPILFVGREITG